ncbi:MAG TPA: ATP synthase subunit I [Woeseiaceae bacterium]|nr:ATP synthase subunit I [Woeseiaceae bacterium]
MTSALDMTGLFYAFAGGLVVGLLFFQGLKMTVERLAVARRPGTLVLLSMLLRFGLAMTALYLLARTADAWELLAAVAGFMVARALVARTLRQRRPPAADKPGPGARRTPT